MNFERQFRQYQIWQFIDRQLATADVVAQAEILSYAQSNSLGSKKTVLAILSEFCKAEMIAMVELTPEGPGRPRKAYTRPSSESSVVSLLIDLSALPKPLQGFIDVESKKQELGKSEIVTQILSWAFLQFLDNYQDDVRPVKPLPSHITEKGLLKDNSIF